MCGIHGILTGKKRINRADDFIKNGFVAGSLRGMDASGIASIDTAKALATVHKLPVPGTWFETNAYAASLMNWAAVASTLTICHTRAGTSGNNGMSCAHPFIIMDEEETRQIVGVHNGTLSGWHNKPAAKGCTVDSEWIYTHIFNKGAKAFQDFTGAYALVWWDSDDAKILNMALNKERPLCIAMLEDGGMAWASEPGMLAWLLERNGIKVVGKIKQLNADHHYKFDVNDPTKYTKEAIQKAPVVVHTNAHTRHREVSGGWSVFERVDNFLKEVKAQPGSQAEGKAQLVKPALTKNEIDQADALKIRGLTGIFQPIHEDEETGDILGDFLSESGTDYTAIIRNSPNLLWTKTSTWYVRVIGVEEVEGIGNEITVICSKPEVKQELQLVH